MRQFEDFVNEQNYFSVESVWSSEEGQLTKFKNTLFQSYQNFI